MWVTNCVLWRESWDDRKKELYVGNDHILLVPLCLIWIVCLCAVSMNRLICKIRNYLLDLNLNILHVEWEY